MHAAQVMTHVTLPDEREHKLPFYLAMEEYIAREFPAQSYFFMWQVQPTVIFGRNQLIDTEVDVAYCRSNGIEFYRRKSGGGCVYADNSNIMLSYITPSTNVNFTFNSYMLMVEHALQKLGIDARTTGRNDILIDGKKVSGNAFYHIPGRSIVHGTMLYDTNLEHMAKAITPSSIKLKSKGVESVRQHVTTLNRYISIGIEEFKKHLASTLCGAQLSLSEDDILAIEEMEKEYYSRDFIYGNNPRYSFTKSMRFDGVGEIHASVEIKKGIMHKLALSGDFMPLGNVGELLALLEGVSYSPEAVDKALSPIECSSYIMNLEKEKLINLLFS